MLVHTAAINTANELVATVDSAKWWVTDPENNQSHTFFLFFPLITFLYIYSWKLTWSITTWYCKTRATQSEVDSSHPMHIYQRAQKSSLRNPWERLLCPKR